MALSAGTRLGPYEIADPLGAGGMGEVYRARDTRLDRTVAIKVIPTHLASVPEVRERFEREARAVSSLNHPHICTLFDVGEERGTHYFVMEHLEGESLAHRLEKGPLELDDLMRTAVEIADALSAAHRHGLVHRDLKPGNVMLTRGGAKLLDFGLARATGLAATAGSGLTQSPTLTRPLTAEGTIVGTFQYMSPEQLEGKEADTRSDIFSFGAVLYEMVTGTRAFQGTSQASLIASILKEQPRPLSETSPLSPPALENVVKRCLAKNPDERWQSISDVKHQLEWIRDAGSSAGVPTPIAARRRSASRVAWLLAGVMGVAAVALGVWTATHRPTPPEVTQFGLMPPPNHLINAGLPFIGISPDGRTLVFSVVDSAGASSLWTRHLGTQEAQPLPGTAEAYCPFWSQDGRSIGFVNGGKLNRLSLASGKTQAIADAPDARGGSWNQNDDIVFQPSATGPLMRVSANGGAVSAVTAIDTANGEEAHRFPWFLPDGKHFLFVVLPARDREFDVCIGDLEGNRRTLMKATSAAVYGNGHLVFARGDQLVAQRFNPDKLELEGEAIAVGEPGGVGGFTGSNVACVSANGVLALSGFATGRTRVVITDRTGRELQDVGVPPGVMVEQEASPDGNRLSFTEWRPDGTSDIWISDLVRDVVTRFTFVKTENYGATWSPDGKTVAFVSSRGGRENIYLKPADGSRDEELLFDMGTLFTKVRAWTSDGKSIVLETLTDESITDLWMVDVQGDRKPVPLLKTRFAEAEARISPDGRWMLYGSDETGRLELYVRSFPSMENKHGISTPRDGVFTNTQNFPCGWVGNEIYYLAQDGFTVMSVTVRTGDTFSSDVPKRLFRLPRNAIDVSMFPDGKRLVVALRDTGGIPEGVNVTLNWPLLLERR